MWRNEFLRSCSKSVILFCVLAVCNSASAVCLQEKLVASDGEAGDHFGLFLDLECDTGIVGAYGDEGEKGAAYIIHYDGSNWVETAKLIDQDGETGDRFGLDVGISGSVVVVGARDDDEYGPSSGSASFFRYDGTNWVQEAKVVAPDGEAGDNFGQAVAIDGCVAIIGAHGGNYSSIAGYAWVYRYVGSAWIPEARLDPSDGQPSDKFGARVALWGNIAVFTSHLHDGIGAAYVYRYDGSVWNEEQKLTPSNGQPGDDFGTKIAICGELVIVTAHADYGSESGSAYIFRYDYDISQWVEEDELVPSDGASHDEFGNGVAIRRDLAVVGATFDDDNGSGSGSAYIYRYDGVEWIEERKIVPPDGDDMDLFGAGIAICGDDVFIGAHGDDENGGDYSGSVYVYGLTGSVCCPGDIDGDGIINVTDLLILLGGWGPCP